MTVVDLHEFDLSLFNKVRKMMKEVFPEFVQAYLHDGARYVDEISRGCSKRQMDIIIQYAHPLKSASASIGAVAVSKIAETLEKSARHSIAQEHHDDTDWQALQQQMEQAFSHVKTKLEAESL